MRRRSDGLVIGYQRWNEIFFVHWRVPVQAVRSLVHPRLSIDLHDGAAWISMTPFTLVRGRLRGLPAVPRLSSFHELNVRTYVHLAGRDPGIWFFSLDATSLPSTLLARASMALPYYWCDVRRSQEDGAHEYACVRRRSAGRARFFARWTIDEPEREAEPGELADFLLNRFRLYSTRARGRLVTETIWHPAWRFHDVRSFEVEQTLAEYDGLPELGAPALAHHSRGVDVEFFPPRPLTDR